MSKPFLQQVADYYASTLDKRSLARLCLIFPNKRSATFFSHYLRQSMTGKGAYVEPQCTDMTAFAASFSHERPAGRYEAVFALYDCYRQLNRDDGREPVSFDRFLYWGETLVSDFNDVDADMADTSAIFTNLERLREISSSYLTEQQREIIGRYWGNDAHMHHAENDEEEQRMWLHMCESPMGKRFRNLWAQLQPLYTAYVRLLQKRGLTTRGLIYRCAAEELRRNPGGKDRFKRYAFVGFNVLTVSETAIFRAMRVSGRADFFWDADSPQLRDPANKACRFLRRYIEDFPMPAGFTPATNDTTPRILIAGVPSGVGQTHVASKAISQWAGTGLYPVNDPARAINTAIVLPDESLLIPLIHALPPEVDSINITMGFPMRLTPVAAMMSHIAALHRNARHEADETVYFYEDVRNLLGVPIVQSVAHHECTALLDYILRERLYRIPYSVLAAHAPSLKSIFTPLPPDGDTSAMAAYIETITDAIAGHLQTAWLTALTQWVLGEECARPASNVRMQLKFIESYVNAFRSLARAMDDFGITTESALTLLTMINKSMRGESVRFSGEPLRGLQVMGMLETRTLDFDNLVILSMNERVFPRHVSNRTFIPDILRRAFGLATTDFQESIFAYYFYRLISRARQVVLTYDSRSVGGARTSEMSRYITQILYLYKDLHARHVTLKFPLPDFKRPATEISKTGAVMDKLLKFTTPGSGWSLSASAINDYISCPLKFYLQHVEGYSSEMTPGDYIDSSTYGTIIHQVLELFYSSLIPPGASNVVVTRDMLEAALRPPYTMLRRLLTRAINKEYLKRDPDDPRPLMGETVVLADVMLTDLRKVLETDMQLDHGQWREFTFLGAEKRDNQPIRIGSRTYNFKQTIDRIDSLERDGVPTIRIVDYKTGSDELTAPSVEALFDGSLPHRPKAIMQLMLYCSVYDMIAQPSQPVMPVLYPIKKLGQNRDFTLKIDGQPIDDYRVYRDEFIRLLAAKLDEIMDPEVKFTPGQTDYACQFCDFANICSRGE